MSSLRPVSISDGLSVARNVYPGEVRRRGGAANRHAFTVLSYQAAGELEMMNGSSVLLRAGDLHVVPAGRPHGMLTARDAEVWSVAVSPGALEAELRASLERIARGALPSVTLPADRRAFVASLFAELARADRTRPARHRHLVALLAAELAEHAAPLPAAPPRDDLASRIVAFIGEHALEPISLAAIARSFGKNRTYVADVVREATGSSVGALVAELRLDEARRRLEQTDELVEVIGERVGYADPTHFARVFRRRFGVSPRGWRKRTDPTPA